ncbi:MAG: hypothetical protein NVS9B14_10110 [Candidatus Acidiferrum sp.]
MNRTLHRRLFSATWLVACFLLSSCRSSSDVRLFLSEPFPQKLSAWHLYTQTRNGLKPNDRVFPYSLRTPLFSDYASKYRFVWMPKGTSARYRDDAAFDFPVGTILSKSFAFPSASSEKLVETRLLVHTNTGWIPLPYIWNDSQTEATLQLVPDPVPVKFGTHDFTYQIPNVNECKECHDNNRNLLPIGPKARNLGKDQVARWAEVGYLQGAPKEFPDVAVWNKPESGSLEERALAYLDNNCAHCHQPGGTAGYTGVDFRYGHFQPGYCKHPNSAGNMHDLQYDIVPGDPEQSILLYRLSSIAPKVMMPQIGRSTVHAEGVSLIRDWISSKSLGSCQ